jgi:nucleotide-binding universal stress UspA family protein
MTQRCVIELYLPTLVSELAFWKEEVMTTFTADCLEQAPGKQERRADPPLIVVVGYDGSEPARRALERAADLLRHHEGELEVVYVAHAPAATELSSEALVQIQRNLDEEADALAAEVHARLDDGAVRWHFQRRDGAVVDQLQTIASEFEQRHPGTAEIVIVTGGSAHWYHHLAGSVGATLARHDRFPVVVVP